MTEASRHLPRRILLATDLSARSDRAEDRATSLARAWGAKLTVVHALDVFEVPNDEDEQPSAADARARAYEKLSRSLTDVRDVDWNIEVCEGRPVDAILRVSNAQNCQLTVIGVIEPDRYGRPILSSTYFGLVERANTPVLVVKRRGRDAYRKAVVASDLSEASICALEMADAMFPPSQLTLFHAFDMPYRGSVDDRRAYEQSLRDSVRNDAREFITHGLGRSVPGLGVNVRCGAPARLLAKHADKEDVDLVIVGTHGRTGLLSILLGSVASAILKEVSCDVLVVPSKGARRDA